MCSWSADPSRTRFEDRVIYQHKWSFINKIPARRASEGIQILELWNDKSTVKHCNYLAGAAIPIPLLARQFQFPCWRCGLVGKWATSKLTRQVVKNPGLQNPILQPCHQPVEVLRLTPWKPKFLYLLFWQTSFNSWNKVWLMFSSVNVCTFSHTLGIGIEISDV